MLSFYQIILTAQDTTFIQVDSFEISSDYFTTDPLQNIYVVTSSGIVQKYNVKGDLLFEYNNENFGKPTFIDATNPLRVLLFYSEYLTAIVLDRTLNELYIYNLIDYNFNQVSLLTTAADNGLWLYDEWTYQIKKINQLGETIVSSNDLSRIFKEETVPTQIFFRNNKLYLSDILVSEYLWVFDAYGELIGQTHLDLEVNPTMQVSEEFEIYSSEKELYLVPLSHDNKAIYIKNISLPFRRVEGDEVRMEGNYLFHKTTNRIDVYKGL